MEKYKGIWKERLCHIFRYGGLLGLILETTVKTKEEDHDCNI